MPNICKLHYKIIDIVCVDCKQKICPNCALFGKHKNHFVKTEDEVLTEIIKRAETLIGMFKIIEKGPKDAINLIQIWKNNVWKKLSAFCENQNEESYSLDLMADENDINNENDIINQGKLQFRKTFGRVLI
ncbi:hypothetical protein IMG5_109210 [Ichthyophthirius multifiliis]|uniref:B box-type domain-containing protein n=1 Tax=Ichthyophthirius multifiliis TaxID=5932 RepID=G0QTJ1_ICHMU|nr:hypothetical protein IMG5_109210 [Ichthyophthirius multifiliis]EGR31462.1 hypothetical protein IMG5_109210 [Ichthyophthirius multifiliis]|eukprot:XP_004034948.1 hypothetical protein IMG5_109210 [Ichthyophthirius multifiliis]